MWIARRQQSVHLALGEGELRQQDGRYECKMSVHHKRDRVITCEFGGDLHLTSLLEGHLKKVCVKFKTKSVVFSVLSFLYG